MKAYDTDQVGHVILALMTNDVAYKNVNQATDVCEYAYPSELGPTSFGVVAYF